MLTDRAPFDYLYLSRRLLTSLHDQDGGARSKWSGGFKLTVPFIGVEMRREPIDKTNIYQLAARSLGIVSDYTGRIGTSNVYIHDEMEFRHGIFAPLMGWPGGKIACYQGEAVTPDDGRVFVALFGSASNVVGRRPAAEEVEYYPSDATGLFALLDAMRETGDTEIDVDYRIDDHGFSPAARAEIAARFALRGATGPSQQLDFLARVFLEEEDLDVDGEIYDRVVIGAPLWISTPKPRAEAS